MNSEGAIGTLSARVERRGVAQLAEHRSPKPGVAGSIPVSPATLDQPPHESKRSMSLIDALPWPACVLDAEGCVVEANAAAMAFGSAPRPLVGSDLFDRLGTSTAVDAARQAFRRRATGETLPGVFALASHTLLLQAIPGTADRVLALFRQPSEQDALLQAKEAQLADLRAIKHSMSNTLMGLLGQLELLGDDPLPAPAAARVEKLTAQVEQIRRGVQHIGDVLAPGGARTS